MLTIADEVLDMYDDPSLTVLLERHGAEGVREKFASVSVPETGELPDLDDDAFGAVFFHKVASEVAPRRAWPVHEPGICRISVDYFHKVASEGRLFPEEVRNQIACNIAASADLHGVEVPDEMRKWADDHGEFVPEDNWVSLDAYDRPGRAVPERFAFEKTAAAGTTKLWPLDDAECVSASVGAFVKEGWDHHGLDEWQARIAANHIVKAAADHGVGVPEDLEVFSQLRQKSAEEIHGALLSRIERVPVSKRNTDQKVAALHEAIGVIEEQTDPIKMAARVTEFDLAVGFGPDHYVAGLSRPESVIFEPAVKEATEAPLIDRIGRDKIAEYLGDDVLKDFETDAKAALDAQPVEMREFLLNA